MFLIGLSSILLLSAIPYSQTSWLWGLSICSYGLVLAFQLAKKFHILALGVLTLLLLLYVGIEGKPVREIISQEPRLETYTTDAMLFLKTYYLMNQGMGYYQSFATAYNGDHRVDGNPPDVWGFRMPTTFYVWHWASFGQPVMVYWIFVVYCVLVLGLSYHLSFRLGGNGYVLLAPGLLMPYLLYGLTTYEFLQAEWWGILPIMIMLYGIVVKRPMLIFLGALGAPLARETYILPVMGVGMWYFFARSWRHSLPFFSAALAYLLIFFIHAQAAFAIIPFNHEMITRGRMHALTVEFIHQVLVYGTWKYWLAPYRLYTIYLIIMLFVALYQFMKRPRRHRLLILQLVCLSLTSLISFLKIGLCCWGDYWGVMTTPFIALSLALLINMRNGKIKKVV